MPHSIIQIVEGHSQPRGQQAASHLLKQSLSPMKTPAKKESSWERDRRANPITKLSRAPISTGLCPHDNCTVTCTVISYSPLTVSNCRAGTESIRPCITASTQQASMDFLYCQMKAITALCLESLPRGWSTWHISLPAFQPQLKCHLL